MSYLLKGINELAFTGQFASYIGSTDPSGWVICDGESRPNENNKYNNLKNMGIGTITVNDYTPPDLQGNLLCGYNTTYLINNRGGANQYTLTVNNLPSHNHGGSVTTTNSSTGTSHMHTFDDYNYDDNNNKPKAEGGDGHGNSTDIRTTQAAVYTNHSVSIDPSGGINSTSTSSINIENRSYVINWIVKI
jgi:microcystin-dependent protein